ncbi:oxygen-independent coproporphyrinogen-3 oxidase [Granulicatella balaenopterae]|uniref:Heme chaperone HemW n=1 Tax=Granulicatella balaenopterae TaxID=137733 RepID=A0A1H9I379_9LACT|nr:radical SAM family heme chaperone HemW [Granulicatella balaenopterae]SEQ68952.1 oxygen-independent coproporphyrinogen-3 oxidase [Granulicatella balaenopterae]
MSQFLKKEVHSDVKTSAYIHIPFCSHICYYCDFNKVFIEGQPVDEYVDLLIEEMKIASQQQEIPLLETLYIGGGTPSTLSLKQMERLLEGIHQYIPLRPDNEFSIELNPDDGSIEKLALLKDYGVNRISMGVQTFHDDLLKAIGRKHRKETVYKTVDAAKAAGFENISIDLIFRLPKQTIADFEETLRYALELDLPHYSIYSLILEHKTVFYNLMRQGKLPLPTQDEEAEMFQMAMDTMEQSNHKHYEISNYAKPGFESRHNLHYWNADEYYGFGAGAHGYVRGERYQNKGPIQHYLEPLRQGKLPILQSQPLTRQAKIEEFMFLGLRKMSGVSYREFKYRFNCSMMSIYQDVILDLEEQGLIIKDDEGIRLSQKGKFLGNNVFQSFLLS